MSKQIQELDGLRGWMALWVWSAHALSLSTLQIERTPPGWLITKPEVAVGVFIILSGFVINMALCEASSQPTRIFYVRRAFRLFPAYLICLLVSAFVMLDLSINTLNALPWPSPHTAGRLSYLQDSRDAFWTHLALHVPLLHGLVPRRILPSTSYAFMGQAWSLTLEWQYYLAAPLLLRFMRWFEWTPVRQGALLVVLALLAQRLGQASMLPSALYLFTIGYFSYQLYRRRDSQPLTAAYFAVHIAIWTLAAALVGQRWMSVLIWAALLFGLVQSATPRAVSSLRRFLCLPISRRLGAISYSFYCSHMIAVFGCAYLLITVLEVTDQATYAAALIGGSLLATIVMSSLLYAFVEKPCIELGRQLARAHATKAKDAAVNA